LGQFQAFQNPISKGVQCAPLPDMHVGNVGEIHGGPGKYCALCVKDDFGLYKLYVLKFLFQDLNIVLPSASGFGQLTHMIGM
jgi:hypothetical protein